MFNTVMDLERDTFLGYSKRCRKDKSTDNKRNGYVESVINGLNDSFTINIPRDRLNNFKPFLLEMIKQEREKMDDLCFRLYTKGLTTRDISKIIGMSRQWVWICVRGKGIKEVEKLNLPDLMEKVEI